MPYTVDEEKMNPAPPRPGEPAKKLLSLDPAHPPVKPIPHMEFPRVVYTWPKEPFKLIEHRNANHELVQTERVPAEHLTRLVNDEKELKKAMAEGWVKEPYVAPPPPDPNANLYEAAK